MFYVEVDILKGHKIIFEDVKSDQQGQQLKFTGVPFVVLGSKNLDCMHGTDHAISRKKKAKAKKMEEKVVFFYFCQNKK